MAHGDAREGKWRGNWRMEWVASTLHTTPEHGVSSITTAGAHISAASSRLNWRPRRFKWTRPFLRNTKSCFCACAITFQMQSNTFFHGNSGYADAHYCYVLRILHLQWNQSCTLVKLTSRSGTMNEWAFIEKLKVLSVDTLWYVNAWY